RAAMSGLFLVFAEKSSRLESPEVLLQNLSVKPVATEVATHYNLAPLSV
ncbi:MAG: hypothetical protein ACI8YB_002132, partial [Patiriisocius sp.]